MNREYANDALTFSLKAVAISGDANNLDTLACVYANRGDFAKAIEIETKAITMAPTENLPDFSRRLQNFTSAAPKDCMGEE